MIFLQPQGGLCNRLRAIAATKAFILEYGLEKRFTLVWGNGGELNCDYRRLFEDDADIRVKNYCSDSYNIKHLYWIIKGRLIPRAINVDGVDKIERFISDIREGKDFWIKTGHQFISSPIDYTFFKPKGKFIIAADKIMESGEVIGVHIRRGDNLRSAEFSPLELFQGKMDEEVRLNPTVRFFVATDSPSVEEKLRERYGNKIIVRPPKELSRNSPRGIEDALIDVLCLSRCRKIYGSFWSSFSEVASQIGNTPLEILSTNKS